jgi:hypothetical protein
VEGGADRDPTSNAQYICQQILEAGLQIEALVETPLDSSLATETKADPTRWYSVPRASVMPTTFIVKARKPLTHRAAQQPLAADGDR